MARRRRYKPIARLRRALLLALILFVGAMAGYYFSGRLSVGSGPSDDVDGDEEPASVGKDVLSVAHGFDYEVTDGEALAYRVKAEKLVSDVQDRMELDRMEVELPQDEGGIVAVVADRGTIHLDSKSALLDGNVVARNEEGVVLNGDRFEVVRDGRQLISKAPVTFGKEGEYTGSARDLHYSIKKERLILEGDVVIQGLPADDPAAGSIRCQKLTYDRLEGTLRLEGDVRVTRGLEFLDAGRLSITFGADESDVRFVRAESGVSGRYLPEPSSGELASRVDFRGKLLYATFEEGTRQARQAELRGRQRQEAVLDMVDESGLSRVVAAQLLSAEFRRGEIATVEASEPVLMVERHAFAPDRLLRRVCSERALLRFDDQGGVDRLALTGNVDYQATDMQAQGDKLTGRGSGGTVAIEGKPARVVSDRGDLQAPRITYSERGSVVATDGVRVELARERGYKLTGSAAAEPVRVTAEKANWEEQPERVTFTGRVRAWQGRDYLLAEQMIGEPDAGRLTATERVKSVMRQQPRARAADDEPGAEDPGAEDPIEITAKKLIYEQTRSVITYEGDARATQSGRVLECEKMDVELDANDEVERLICTGDLRVEDPAQGKEVVGDKAIYLPGQDEVDVTGEPVVLTDQDGTELKGGRIVYRFDTGAAQIRSRPVPTAAAGESR